MTEVHGPGRHFGKYGFKQNTRFFYFSPVLFILYYIGLILLLKKVKIHLFKCNCSVHPHSIPPVELWRARFTVVTLVLLRENEAFKKFENSKLVLDLGV